MVQSKDHCAHCGELLQEGQEGVCSEECYDERVYAGVAQEERCWNCQNILPLMHQGFCSEACRDELAEVQMGKDLNEPTTGW